MLLSVEKGNEGLLLIWRIENFSYCSQKKGELLRSPIFVADTLGNSKWKLLLAPRGTSRVESNGYSISYYLNRWSDSGPENIPVNFVLSIRDIDGSFMKIKEVSHLFVKNKEGLGFDPFLSRDEVYGKKGIGFLQNDTMTVCCRMLRSNKQLSNSGQCFARTRIRVEKKTFTWAIKDFSALQPNQKNTIQVETALETSPSLNMNLFLAVGSFSEESIKVEFIANDNRKLSFVTCKISLLDVKGKVVNSKRDEHLFEAEGQQQVWHFPPLITKNKLMARKNIYLSNDELRLKCELAISDGSEFSEVEHTICGPPAFETLDAIVNNMDNRMSFNSSDSLKTDLHSLYSEGKLSDFTLRTNNMSYPVHKAILGARSPVFNAMFERNMKEKQTGVVEIEDLDYDTVQRMLLFMYTDAVEDLEWKNAMRLYGAADKYEILPLKQKCSHFLKTSLNPSNVCEVLFLADMHQDEDMKSATLNFISNHGSEVIGSDAWNTFMQSNFQLAAETMQEIYMREFGIGSKNSYDGLN